MYEDQNTKLYDQLRNGNLIKYDQLDDRVKDDLKNRQTRR